MYVMYWRLQERPFDNTHNPRFIYYSQKHQEALSRLLYVIREQRGGALLTGEYGSGKTLLSKVLLEELSSEQYQTALILNPMLTPLELLKEIAYQLGGNISSLSTKIDLLHYFNGILYRNRTVNKNTVIVIDEAQSIPIEGFEELRLLLNFQLNDNFLFNLILLGQPELKTKINSLPQLRQRLGIRYHLTALNPEQTREYVQHRLKVAGAKEEIFLEDAYSEIYRFSGGIPRIINNICDMALLIGCAEGLTKIDRERIREVAQDLEEVPVDAREEVRVADNG